MQMDFFRKTVVANGQNIIVPIPSEWNGAEIEIIAFPVKKIDVLKEKDVTWQAGNEMPNRENTKQRIYIDTSIVGGFFDKEFADSTKALFEKLKQKEVIFVISDLLRRELIAAPENVRSLLENYEQDCFEPVRLTEKAKELANDYITEKVIGKTSLEDCQHIAIATLNKVDILASWNFKHIVNINRIRGYNSVNLKNGYATLEIRNPRELVDYD
ncbi:MAG: hypothetical protein FWC15_05825 [Fibromonadales bacterium]|nr:hypothetical protein [Fibromonadales bacterium]